MPSRREVYVMDGWKPTFGPSRLTESNFPFFLDGSVEINITLSRRYQLHKSILERGSPRFAMLFSDEYTATLSTEAKKTGAVITNMLCATPNDFSQGENHPFLILKPVKLDDEGRPITATQLGLDLENGVLAPPAYLAFGMVLGAFYNQPMDLHGFKGASLDGLTEITLEVARVAEYLECVDVVTQHLEAALFALGQSLHRVISQCPSFWLDFSIRMHSKPLYQESLIHAVGQINTQEMQDWLPLLDTLTRGYIVGKAIEITDQVKLAISRMLYLNPTAPHRPRSVDLFNRAGTSRDTLANDILYSMALIIYRQWVAQQILLNKTHHAGDLGYDFMNTMRKGDSEYLNAADLEVWHEFFPMSPRSKNGLASKLNDVKMHVKTWTYGLFVNHSNLDVNEYEPKYFTCAAFALDTWPWTVQSQGNAVQGTSNGQTPGEGMAAEVADDAMSVNTEVCEGEEDSDYDLEFEEELMSMDAEHNVN